MFVRLDIMERMVEIVPNVLQIIIVLVELCAPSVVMSTWLHHSEVIHLQLVSVRVAGMVLQMVSVPFAR